MEPERRINVRVAEGEFTRLDTVRANRGEKWQPLLYRLLILWESGVIEEAVNVASEALKRNLDSKAAIEFLLDQYRNAVPVKLLGSGIDDSTTILETTQVPPDMQEWLRIAKLAVQVQDPSWKRMLRSIRGQLELVAERAFAEIEARQTGAPAPPQLCYRN